MRKSILRLAVLLLLCIFALSACGNNTQVSSDDAVIVFPEPESMEEQSFFGETDKSEPREFTLHYVSDDRYALTSVTSAISIARDENLIGSVLEELFSASTEAPPHTAVSGAKLIDYEHSGSTVTVNLTADSLLYQNEIETQLFLASISNTLLGLDGIDAVNILAGGRSMNLSRLPLGVQTSINENIPASYAQLESESDRFLEGGNVSFVRSAMLYFPTESGEYMLPEVRSIEFDSADCISLLIEALKTGPLTESACISSIPESVDLFNSAPYEAVNASGERIIYLDFNSLMLNYLAFAGLEEWELYASIVLTLTSFIPETDAVCIMIDGEKLAKCMLPDRTIEIEDGCMFRSDFSGRIGSAAELYFANENGRLTKERCALSRIGAASPKRLLESLIVMQSTDPELANVFPEGINPEDILGAMVRDRVANINLSANFYARCQSLDAVHERRLVYAMVNTLSELENIGAVRFFVEGRQVDTLADTIYLKTALLPDRGLVDEN